MGSRCILNEHQDREASLTVDSTIPADLSGPRTNFMLLSQKGVLQNCCFPSPVVLDLGSPVFFCRPWHWELGDCTELQPTLQHLEYFESYLKNRKEIKEQRNCVLKSFLCFRVASWVLQFDSWVCCAVAWQFCEHVGVSWQSQGVTLKDKYSLIIILVFLCKENASVSGTA